MKVSIVSFSIQGAELSNRIKKHLTGKEVCLVQNTTNKRAAHLVPKTAGSLYEWTKEQFREADVVIFIGACGIAVRSIAPFVTDKRTDPAVLVIDDCGRYVISLLSGHLGGANAWAERIAKWIGALPVITTASDSRGKMAFDLLAKNNDLFITDMRTAKILESAYLDGEKIGICSDLPYDGPLPKDLFEFSQDQEKGKYGIYIGTDPVKAESFVQTLWLIPRCMVAGIGCRRGKSEKEILRALEKAMDLAGYPPESLFGIASIDLKKDEQGILDAVKSWRVIYGKISCEFYTADELKSVKESLSRSPFVREITGVDNVCERAALYAAVQESGEKGSLILPKQVMDGVTVALAKMERRISFE